MDQRTAFRFSLEQWDGTELRKKLLSDRAVFDTTTGHWTVFDYTLRTFEPEGERIHKRVPGWTRPSPWCRATWAGATR